jgi:hypothetical protein
VGEDWSKWSMVVHDREGLELFSLGMTDLRDGNCGRGVDRLGTFMAADVRHFNTETVRNMQVALDLAWSSLSPEHQAQSSKLSLATRILNAAEAGERSPARLLMLALMSASSPSGHSKLSVR